MPSFDLSKINIERLFSTFFSQLAKRYGENWYDRLPELPFFQVLQKQSSFVKHGVEGVIAGLTGILDQTVAEDTFFRKFFKEIGMDFGSEFSKRLINGKEAKETLIRNPGRWETHEERELVSILADMEDSDLADFLNWANTTTTKERKKDIETFRKLTADQIIKLNKNPERFKDLLEYFRGPRKDQGVVHDFLNPFRRELIERAKKRRGGSNEQ